MKLPMIDRNVLHCEGYGERIDLCDFAPNCDDDCKNCAFDSVEGFNDLANVVNGNMEKFSEFIGKEMNDIKAAILENMKHPDYKPEGN